MISKETMIQTIEKSSSINEASQTLGISYQAIYKRLKRHNLKVIKTKSLKVVEKE